MKTLTFKLSTNNEEVINGSSNYFIKENVMNFIINEETYSYNLDNNILIKKNNESSICINPNESIIHITLLEQNLTFDMEIIDFKVKNDDNKIIYEYSFMSDEKTTNCITIDY